MTTYRLTYIPTGRQIPEPFNYVYINTGDDMADGRKVRDMADALQLFEQIAADWGTYETRHAVTEIKTV